MPHQESKHLTSGSHRGWVPSDGGVGFTGPDGSPNLGAGFVSVNIELSLELWSGIAGVSYSNLGQHQRAIEDYDKVIELDPNDAEAQRPGFFLP